MPPQPEPGRTIRTTPRIWRGRAPLVAVLVLALVCVIAVYQVPRGERVDLGGGDDALTRNFFIPERSPSYTFRWSRDSSLVFLRGLSAGTNTLSIGAAAPRPAGIRAPRVTVLLDGKPVGQFTVKPDYQRLTFPITIPWDALGNHTVTIKSETFKEQNRAARDLGIAVDDVVVTPGGPQIPPLVPVLTFVLDAVFIYALIARRFPRVAFVVAIALIIVGALYQAGLRQPLGPVAYQLFFPLAFTWGTVALVAALRRNGVEQTWAAIGTVAIGTTALAAAYYLLQIHAVPSSDFNIFYTAATRLRLHEYTSVYDLEGIKNDPEFVDILYKNPPFPAMMLEPLSLVRYGNAVLFWRASIVLVVAAAVWLLARELNLWRIGVPRGWPLIALVVLVMLWSPLRDSVRLGQWDGLLLLLMTLAFIGLRRDRPWLTGSAIALAGIIKIFPLYAVVFLVMKRQWRALLWLIGASLILIGVSILGAGWSIHAYFAFEILPAVSGTTDNPENQSVASLLFRMARGHLPIPVMTIGSLVVVTALLVWHLRRQHGRANATFALDYGLTICATVLCTPVAWMHYEVMLFIPLAIVLARLAERPRMSLGWLAALAGSVALLTYGSHTTLLMALLYESRDLTRAFLQSTRVFAQIGFALAIWYLAAHSGVPVGEPAPVAEPADEARLPAHSR